MKEEVQPWQSPKQEEFAKSEPVEKNEVSEPNNETETEVGNTLIDDTSNDDDWNEKQEDDQRDKTYDDENVIGLNFVDAVGTCIKKFFNFKDRASRSEYWYFQLVFTIVSLPLFIYEDSSNDTHLIYSGISGIIVLILFIPAISVSVRRLHDINKSGWFVFISVIPYLGWIILAIMLIEKGTLGKNKFGKYPLKFK